MTSLRPDVQAPPAAPPAPTRPDAPRSRRSGSGGRLTPAWLPWLLQAPALVVLAGLLLYPLYRVGVLSFQDFGLRELVTGETTWVGLANFREVLNDPLLWKVALPNTVVFAT